jgi:hypothetical protein
VGRQLPVGLRAGAFFSLRIDRNVGKCQSMSCFCVFFLGVGPEFSGFRAQQRGRKFGSL